MNLQQKIIRLVQKSDTELPTLPVIVNHVLEATSDDNTSQEDLAEIIKHDPGITNKLLKLANSVYYGQRTPVDTIKRAITVIGFDEIVGIVIGMNILSSLADKESGLGLDMKALWIHSIACATAVKEIAEIAHPDMAAGIFIPGLLHDMGKIILSVYFKEAFREIRFMAMEKKKPLFRVESSVLKLNHAILSGLLMKRWRFPPHIINPCSFHHNPHKCPEPFRTSAIIVNLGNYLCHKCQIGHSGNTVPVTIKDALGKIGLNKDDVRNIIDTLRKKEGHIKEFFEITTRR